MRRHLAPLPATYSLTQLRQAAAARFPTLIDFNTVDVNGTPNAAIYLPDSNTTDPAPWQASVAAHVPTHPTPEERAASEAGNEATIRDQATAALAANATFLSVAAPTNAQIAAQVKALTRQVNSLIRLAVGRFDGTD